MERTDSVAFQTARGGRGGGRGRGKHATNVPSAGATAGGSAQAGGSGTRRKQVLSAVFSSTFVPLPPRSEYLTPSMKGEDNFSRPWSKRQYRLLPELHYLDETRFVNGVSALSKAFGEIAFFRLTVEDLDELIYRNAPLFHGLLPENKSLRLCRIMDVRNNLAQIYTKETNVKIPKLTRGGVEEFATPPPAIAEETPFRRKKQ